VLRFTLPVARGNEGFKDGHLARTTEAMFSPLDGRRGGMIFFDLADPSKDYTGC
jgi:hypothetical protein